MGATGLVNACELTAAGGLSQQVRRSYGSPSTGSPVTEAPPHALSTQAQLDSATDSGQGGHFYNAGGLIPGNPVEYLT